MTPIEQSYRLIAINKGLFAIVDACDYEWLMQWKWRALWKEASRTWYVVRTPTTGKRTQIRMHREILGLKSGDSRTGDHHDHNGLNNRRGNLRIATAGQQQANTRTNKNSATGHKGVSWNKNAGKYKVSICHEGRPMHLGYFSELERASKAYKEAAKRLKGEFACF